jgi:hypothetical protein
MTPRALVLAATVLLLALLARPAAALPAPSDSTLSQWRAAIAAGSRLRLNTPTGILQPLRVQIDSSGLHYDALANSAFVVFEQPGRRERLLHWEDVDRIELSHGNGAGRGAITGMVAGFVVSEGIALALKAYLHSQIGFADGAQPHTAPFVVSTTAIGGALGALIGSGSTHWLTVAP